MIHVDENEKRIKISLNITMKKKEIKRINDKMALIEEPEGEYDIIELISKTAKISPKKAEDFLTVMQLMSQQKMMEEQSEDDQLDSKEIFGI